MGDLGDPALLPLPLARPRDAGGYEGVVDVLVQEDPEPTVESGDIKRGVVEVLGLVLQSGQDLHHQLVWDVVAVDKEGRPNLERLALSGWGEVSNKWPYGRCATPLERHALSLRQDSDASQRT